MQMTKKDMKIFLSSAFSEDMLYIRSLFRNEILANLNHIAGASGHNVYISDYEMGIPVDTPIEDILKYCFDQITAADAFILILSNDYGTEFKNLESLNMSVFNKNTHKDTVLQAKQLNLSVLEMEVIEAMRIHREDYMRLYLISENIDNNKCLILQERINSDQRGKIIEFSGNNLVVGKISSELFKESTKQPFAILNDKAEKNRFWANKKRYFVSNDAAIDQLNSYVADPGSGQVQYLVGPSGSGKTTSLLKWEELLHSSEHQLRILSFYCGLNGNTVFEAMHTLYKQEEWFAEENRIDETFEEKAVQMFSFFIAQISKRYEKVLVIIDGFYQVASYGTMMNRLHWIPSSLPENVRLVVSALGTEALNNSINITPLCYESFIRSYCIAESKELEAERIISETNECITKQCKPTGDLLFWRLYCREIFEHAKYHNLRDVINDYFERNTNSIDAYQSLLSKLADRIRNRAGCEIVYKLLGIIHFSLYGFKRSDLCSIIGNNYKGFINEVCDYLFSDISVNSSGRMKILNPALTASLNSCTQILGIEPYCREAILSFIDSHGMKDQGGVYTLEEIEQSYMLKDSDRIQCILENPFSAKIVFESNKVNFSRYYRLVEDREVFKQWPDELGDDNYSFCSFFSSFFELIGRYDEAIEYKYKAIDLTKQRLGEDSLDYGEQLRYLSILLLDSGDNEGAYRVAKNSLEITSKNLGEDNKGTAQSYHNLALVLSNQGKYRESLDLNRKALNIRTRILGDHPDTAESWGSIGVDQYYIGDYKAALVSYNNDLDISMKCLGEKHPNIALAYNNIALVLDDMGNHEGALQYLHKALLLDEEILGTYHLDTALVFSNLAVCHSEIAERDNDSMHDCESLMWNVKALVVRKRVLGETHSDVALSYNGLGVSFLQIEDFLSARMMLDRAMTIASETTPEAHWLTAAILHNLGRVCLAVNEQEEALSHLFKAININSVLQDHSLSLARNFNLVAQVYSCQKKYSEACDYQKMAIDLIDEINPGHPLKRQFIDSLGIAGDKTIEC